MRTRIQKTQVKYLVDLITHHIEAIPDDIPRWVQCLKLAYKALIIMDTVGIFEMVDRDSVLTLDRIYESLRNEFSKNDLYFPDNKKYYN